MQELYEKNSQNLPFNEGTSVKSCPCARQLGGVDGGDGRHTFVSGAEL